MIRSRRATPTLSSIETNTVHTVVVRDGAESPEASNLPGISPTAFLWMPSLPLPSSSASPLVSISTTTETVLEEFTSTIYEQPEIVTVTAAPTTVTNTITVSEPFTATAGSFWSAPERFSNLDSFKIAHFACGEGNLQITSGMPLDAIEGSQGGFPPGAGDYMKTFYDEVDSWNTSSALQLFYPANSINPGNSPQGGADFYATPLPLADTSNVTLEYSVFFPKNFDWVLGGKLPGLYGGHMTCSGGDDATQCFSTRLMWRAGGAGELYLYAPKDKQTHSLCHAPPESVCDTAYGLSVARGAFKFSPGEWTHVRQTVVLNTPGKQNGGFRLEVNGRDIMNRHDVFYRDVPSITSTSSNPTQTDAGDNDTDDGGLLSPLLGGVLGAIDKAGIDEGVLPPFAKNSSSSSTSSNQFPLSDPPPLLPFQQFSGLPITGDAASAIIYNLTITRSVMAATMSDRPTITQTAPRSTATIASYVWEHAFNTAGKEATMPGLTEEDGEPKPIGFSGLFFRFPAPSLEEVQKNMQLRGINIRGLRTSLSP
ncbi:polysaccharide lyase family 14 protein [Sanghuangporus baumii]|uniref:Polysaccharide lyase family 14 protein n=1 Tax=Sanghuangporus baumii TaxID=108892 RepID=A0A9Q5I3Q0_SANBA|nr:polysaccharide lyase family 14 protein [Sanghuangporus baumii]